MNRINPNHISSLRLVLGPVALILLRRDHLAWALVVMVVGELSDLLDGFVARRNGSVTKTGKAYDPLCDSVFHLLVWAAFLKQGWISAEVFSVFLFRDLAVSTMRTLAAQRGMEVSALRTGKAKMVAQAAGQIGFVAPIVFRWGSAWENVSSWLIVAAVAITLCSLLEYWLHFVWQRRIAGASSES